MKSKILVMILLAVVTTLLSQKVYYSLSEEPHNLLSINTDESENTTIFTTKGVEYVNSIGIDYQNEKLYLAVLDGNNTTDRVRIVDLDGIAIDSILIGTKVSVLEVYKEKLYYVLDSGTAELKRSNLDGSNPETLYTPANGSEYINGIAFDENLDKIYYSVREGNSGRVDKANLDGSNVSNISNNAVYTINIYNNKLYYALQQGNYGLERSDLDGTDSKTLFTPNSTEYIKSIGIDKINNKLYYVVIDGDNSTNRVIKADLNGANAGTFLNKKLYTLNVSNIQENATPTASNNIITTDINSDKIFGVSDFNYLDSDTDPFAGVKITTTPQYGILYIDANKNGKVDNGEKVSANGEVLSTVITDSQLKFKPKSNEAGNYYSFFRFKVYDGTSYSNISYNLHIHVENPSTSGRTFGTANSVGTGLISGSNMWDYHCADFDNDGDTDITALEGVAGDFYWFKNDGSGNFSLGQKIEKGARTYATNISDIDNDGDIDIIISEWDGDIYIYKNNGAGVFDGGTKVYDFNVEFENAGTYYLNTADLDDDGDMDIVTAQYYYEDGVHIYENDGAGGFTKASSKSLLSANSVDVADFDGDGDLDIVASNQGANISWWANDGTGTLTFGNENIVTTSGHSLRHVEAIDMDGDGHMDILTSYDGTALERRFLWFKNNGSGTFLGSNDISGNTAQAYGVHGIDMDQDGDIDVIGALAGGNKNHYYENDGSENFSLRKEVANTYCRYVGYGDIDGDGYFDIVSTGSTEGSVAWYKNQELAPEIDLTQNITQIADGGSYDFGNRDVNSENDIVFTISNSGSLNLTITTPITISGTNSDQFMIESQPSSPVIPNGSTTFTVRFTPTSSGVKTASLDISSNDSDENPYNITLNGTGVVHPGLWTGSEDSAWSKSSNWHDGNIPTTIIDVRIPIGCSQYPIVDEAAQCQNLIIENGGEITINNSFNLAISEGMTLQNGSTLINNGKIKFNGTGNYDLIDLRDTKITLGDIEIEGATITNQSDGTVVSNLFIATDSELNQSSNSFQILGIGDIDGTLSIGSGNVDVDGSFDATDGNLTFTGSGSINLSSNVISLGNFTKGNSTITYDGGDQTIISTNYNQLSFDGSTSGSTKTFDNGDTKVNNEIVITDNITLTGSSPDNVTVQVTTPYDWNGTTGNESATLSRVFNINGLEKTVNISNISIKGGDLSVGKNVLGGGAIVLQIGTLDLDNVKISGSKASDGGAISAGANSTLIIRNSDINNNRSTNSGGAIFSSGNTNVSNTTLSSNSSGVGGAFFIDEATLIIENSTISGNSASDGGGVQLDISSLLRVSNSTITGNTASNGGGISSNLSSLEIVNSTISNNIAGSGGGGIKVVSGSAFVANSIIINNSGTNGGDIFYQSVSKSMSFNIYNSWYNDIHGDLLTTQISAPNLTTVYTVGDLQPLADNEGTTQTHAISLETSPAYQSGTYLYYNETDGFYLQDNLSNWHKLSDWNSTPTNSELDKIAIDQRGLTRQSNTNIGAYDQTLNQLPTYTKVIDDGEQPFEVNEGNTIEITYDQLIAKGDEDDTDGSIVKFKVLTTSQGTTLKIGDTENSATAWAANTNDIIETGKNVYWYTDNVNEYGDGRDAFTLVAVDDKGGESTPAIWCSVDINPLNDAPQLDQNGEPTITKPAVVRIGATVSAEKGSWNDDLDNPPAQTK